MGRIRQMNNKYNDYTKAYNELAKRLEELGANDEIFIRLADVCNKALNINIDILCCEK